MLFIAAAALLSIVAAVPGTSGARPGNLPAYSPIPGGVACNHTVTPEAVENSCPFPVEDIPGCDTPAVQVEEGGPFVYICKPLENEEPYCNQAYSPELKQLQAVCTQPFHFAPDCTETVDDGAFAYTCPWDPSA